MYDRIPVGLSEIIAGFLWLGSCKDAKNRRQLVELGITHIFNCALEWKPRSTTAFVYKCGAILDLQTQDLSLFLAEGFEFLDEVKRSKGRVFVHCVAGKSRSAALTIAYLMRTEKTTLKQAFYHVKSRRSLIMPNDGFMRQLLDFELQLYGYNSMIWGEWKDLSKCPLAPPFSKLTTSDENTSNQNINININTNPNPNPNPNTNTSTVISNSISTNQATTSTKPEHSPIQKEALDLFLKTHVTPEFLQQGVKEVCGGVFDMANMGDVLQWVNSNIRNSTSSGEEVRMEGVSWKDLSHSIDKSAKNWLRSQAGAVTSAE